MKLYLQEESSPKKTHLDMFRHRSDEGNGLGFCTGTDIEQRGRCHSYYPLKKI